MFPHQKLKVDVVQRSPENKLADFLQENPHGQFEGNPKIFFTVHFLALWASLALFALSNPVSVTIPVLVALMSDKIDYSDSFLVLVSMSFLKGHQDITCCGGRKDL